MKYSRLWLAASIIAFVIVAGFFLSAPRSRNAAEVAAPQSAAASVPSVSLHDVYKKGVHTITGSLLVPDACRQVSVEASLSGEEAIMVALFVPEVSGICLQAPTRVNFKATVTAPAGLPLRATVNGEAATTTVS